MAVTKFLDPKNDIMFKKIFGSEKYKEVAINFLNSILKLYGESQIENILFLNNIDDKEAIQEKQSVINAQCRDRTGRRFIVEMQVAKDPSFAKRSWCDIGQVLAKPLEKNEKYLILENIYFIVITDFELFQTIDRYISRFNMKEENDDFKAFQEVQIVTVELPKFKKTKINDLDSTIEKWCYFFKYAENTTEEDLIQIRDELPVMGVAYDALDQSLWSEAESSSFDEISLARRKAAGVL